MSETDGKAKVVRGDALAPTLEVAEQDERFPYWVGSLPDCPLECVHVAGLEFPKIVRPLVLDPEAPTSGRKVQGPPMVGQVVYLTRRKLDLLAAKLPRKVFRFLPSGGKDVDDPHARAGGKVLDTTKNNKRSAMILDVPTPDEIAAREKRGRPTRRFTPRANDEHVAGYLYCVPAPHGRAPGMQPPPPLNVTGLEYPSDEAEPTPRESAAR